MLETSLVQALKGMLSSRTKLVATLHVSNVLGSIIDVKDLAQAVHAVRIAWMAHNPAPADQTFI